MIEDEDVVTDCFDAECKLGIWGVFPGLKPVRYLVTRWRPRPPIDNAESIERNRERDELLRLQNKCDCGETRVPGLTRCQSCRELESARGKARRLQKRIAGSYGT